jgi:hypothetical protein
MATESKSDPDLKRKSFNIEDIDFDSSYPEKCVPDEKLTMDERALRLRYILTECKSSKRLSRMVERDGKVTLYEPFGQAVTAFLY